MARQFTRVLPLVTWNTVNLKSFIFFFLIYGVSRQNLRSALLEISIFRVIKMACFQLALGYAYSCRLFTDFVSQIQVRVWEQTWKTEAIHQHHHHHLNCLESFKQLLEWCFTPHNKTLNFDLCNEMHLKNLHQLFQSFYLGHILIMLNLQLQVRTHNWMTCIRGIVSACENPCLNPD